MIDTLKQDLRSTREDPRDQVKSKHEDWNQAIRKITKKRAHRGDQMLDRALDRTLDESDRTLRSRGSAIGVSSSDRTLDRTLAANRPDVGQQSSVEYKEVPE